MSSLFVLSKDVPAFTNVIRNVASYHLVCDGEEAPHVVLTTLQGDTFCVSHMFDANSIFYIDAVTTQKPLPAGALLTVNINLLQLRIEPSIPSPCEGAMTYTPLGGF